MSWNTEIKIAGAEWSQVFGDCHHDVMTGFT